MEINRLKDNIIGGSIDLYCGFGGGGDHQHPPTPTKLSNRGYATDSEVPGSTIFVGKVLLGNYSLWGGGGESPEPHIPTIDYNPEILIIWIPNKPISL